MTQSEALELMLSGANVFLTGQPGAGKTYTLNKYIDEAEKRGLRLAITASTGIAASHINGTTIHSWSGLGIADALTERELVGMRTNNRLKKRYKNTDVLIIDEVSMLHGARLDLVNKVSKELRGNTQPFGGMQVILVGDLFQLPPVNRDSSFIDFVHKSRSWIELDPQICYLTEQHRQSLDDKLVNILIAMRDNNITSEHVQTLKACIAKVPDVDMVVTKLYSHNADVDSINQAKLDELPGKEKHFTLRASGLPQKAAALIRNILAPEELALKVGAEVMFVANNFASGYVNGTRGTVVNFKHGEPIVKLLDGRTVRVEEYSWKLKEDDMVIAEVVQIPLRLAWAITIHKSQGMSLDAAEIDLSKAFTPGMGYVALSRVRSLDGLYLKGLNDVSLKMHQEIYELDELLLKGASR